MPSTVINVGEELTSCHSEGPDSAIATSCVASSPLGLFLLDVQGEIILPHENSKDRYDRATLDQVYEAVKFGRLEIDKANPSKATLFIGDSQRLIGKIVDLPKPIGIMRVSGLPSEMSSKDSGSVEIIDIVKKKLLFDGRPLPIM